MNDMRDIRINASSGAIAVVSGKGGSGKTMIAAMMARIMDLSDQDTLLIDCDTATAGLTYYLGLKYLTNTAIGLSNLLTESESEPRSGLSLFDSSQQIKGWRSGRFLGVGDHRRLYRELEEPELGHRIERVLRQLRSGPYGSVIADCRGGIDQESLAVCRAMDQIVLVVETDTASFQACEYLTDVLAAAGLADKLAGFVINKAFDDPSVIARNGTAVFKCRYLGAVPFDFETTRAFLIGNLPKETSVFGTHMWQVCHNLLPTVINPPRGRIWSFEEFRAVGMLDPDSQRGGVFMAGVISALFMMWLLVRFHVVPSRAFISDVIIAYLTFAGMVGSIENLRRLSGQALSAYFRLITGQPRDSRK
jgi:septum site-determining protein MinD